MQCTDVCADGAGDKEKKDITIEYKEEEGTDLRTFTVKSPHPHRRDSFMEWDRDMQGTFIIRKIPTLYRI